jgi:hypothetical protein
MEIWSILRPLGIFGSFYIWSFGIFFSFWYLVSRKIWQPCKKVEIGIFFQITRISHFGLAGFLKPFFWREISRKSLCAHFRHINQQDWDFRLRVRKTIKKLGLIFRHFFRHPTYVTDYSLPRIGLQISGPYVTYNFASHNICKMDPTHISPT